MEVLDRVHKFWNVKYKDLLNEELIVRPVKYSEHGEEDIIKCVFPPHPFLGGYFVDVGAHSSNSSNTWLLAEEGWHGIMIEASDIQYPELRDKWEDSTNITVVHEYVTPTSLEKILKHYKVNKDFDFLSIDVDSFEYEIWRNLKNYQPKLVCIEFNQFELDPKVINYDPSFSLNGREGYGGASLGLLNKLAKEKGYDYLCQDVSNAFYIRRDDA